MDKVTQKIGILLVYLCLLLSLFICVCIFPYKEVLKCRDNNCYVERTYVLFNNRADSFYTFNRTDDIQVVYNAHHTTRGVSYYSIDNLSDYNFSIFDNGFADKKTPEKLIAKIKSNDSNIKITKYWFGYKIEK